MASSVSEGGASVDCQSSVQVTVTKNLVQLTSERRGRASVGLVLDLLLLGLRRFDILVIRLLLGGSRFASLLGTASRSGSSLSLGRSGSSSFGRSGRGRRLVVGCVIHRSDAALGRDVVRLEQTFISLLAVRVVSHG